MCVCTLCVTIMAETSVESYLRSRGNLKNDEDWITKRRVETVTTKYVYLK